MTEEFQKECDKVGEDREAMEKETMDKSELLTEELQKVKAVVREQDEKKLE